MRCDVWDFGRKYYEHGWLTSAFDRGFGFPPRLIGWLPVIKRINDRVKGSNFNPKVFGFMK